MIPRPYQLDCLSAIHHAFAVHSSTLVEAATGIGKTVILALLARDWRPGRVLILAHRDELIRQAVEKVQAITGQEPGIEMGTERVLERGLLHKPRIVVSSVQTMCRPARHTLFDPLEFGLVIVDEAHHTPAVSYRNVLGYFGRNPQLKVLGVTATAQRSDRLALGQVFFSVAFRYGIEQAVADGWLVPVSQQVVKVEGLDFSKVRTIAGDFHEGELETILTEEKILHRVAAPVAEIAGSRSALVFCCSVKHAELMAAVLDRYKPGSSAWLSGATPLEKRREVVQKYKAGQIQFLCNCALMLEGFDAPCTALVVMARPTKSPVLYQQVLGRGTRPLPGTIDHLPTPAERQTAIAASAKPNMVALDFVGNAGKHKIVLASDILGGKWGAPVQAYARQILAEETQDRPVAVAEALDRAEAELDLLEEEKERRRLITANATYHTREVSPFDSRTAAAADTSQASPTAPGSLSKKQLGFLCGLGVPAVKARQYSKKEASREIARLLAAKEEKVRA
jgi:superfamily II DNA or RNA helicase